ncbi:hypothetical protein GCM10009662_16040 [Catellatospora coxensis]|uniref:Uncharacterized protein n=1 Tax=Catellatospora coxensis TaxID=310354 RepID=A0A8J3KQ51_9ACTN|nr:hypothetical protein Cco03nite_09280 [Catellatospora coxensis]
MATWAQLASTELLAAGNPSKNPLVGLLLCVVLVAAAVGMLVYATRGDRR